MATTKESGDFSDNKSGDGNNKRKRISATVAAGRGPAGSAAGPGPAASTARRGLATGAGRGSGIRALQRNSQELGKQPYTLNPAQDILENLD